jgi:PEP-CTERM motif
LKFHSLIHIFLLTALSGVCHAAGYFSNFSSATVGDPLVPIGNTFGVDGWTQSEVNNDNLSPKAWIANVGSPLEKGVAIGAFYDSYASDPFYINHTLSSGLATSSLSMKLGVNDSASYQYRNDFSIGLLNSSAANLLTIDFKANSQNFASPTLDDLKWNVWVNGVLTAVAIQQGSSYDFVINFTQDASDVDWTLNINGADWTTGTIIGGASETIGNLRIGTTQANGADWGDNVFGVTAISIPEPSIVLLLGFSVLGLFHRRRG